MKTHTPTIGAPTQRQRPILEAMRRGMRIYMHPTLGWLFPDGSNWNRATFYAMLGRDWIEHKEQDVYVITEAGRTALTRAQGVTEGGE